MPATKRMYKVRVPGWCPKCGNGGMAVRNSEEWEYESLHLITTCKKCGHEWRIWGGPWPVDLQWPIAVRNGEEVYE